MRAVFLALFLSLASFGVHAESTTTVITITTAQQDAETMARTGILRHCGRSGGILEGIGCGSSRESAIRNCCFWGRPYREIGVCQSRSGKWFACVRYK